jgi:hypothetical protein
VLIVPLGAALITVAALTAGGLALNLFTVCALLLVVGMAFDDAIFFAFHGRDSAPTALAVLMSATTTLVRRPAVAQQYAGGARFGITLALGIASAYLLARLPHRPTPHTNSKESHDGYRRYRHRRRAERRDRRRPADGHGTQGHRAREDAFSRFSIGESAPQCMQFIEAAG